MSYCVHCGVELADSEKQCPLCQTTVINPRKPWQEPISRPYPKYVEQIIKAIDFKYVAWLASLILSIPVIVSLLCDIIVTQQISWSAYVTGACACIFVWIFVPLLFKKIKPYLYVLFNFLSSIAFLTLISWRTSEFSWFLPIGLPITFACAALALVTTFIIRRKHISMLIKISFVLLSIAFTTVAIECITDLFVSGAVFLNWSVYVVAVFSVTAIIFSVLDRRRHWKDEIRKRLFF